MPHRTTVEIDDRLIERHFGWRRLRLRFAPALEAHFEAETGAARSRSLMLPTLAGILFYVLYLWADWELTPDILPIAIGVRLGIVVPLALLVLLALWRNPAPVLREAAIGFVALLAAASTLGLMLISDSPLRHDQQHSIVLVMLFITTVARLRFPFALGSTVVTFALYIGALQMLDGYEPALRLTDTLVTGTGVAMALIASWSLEYESRRSYLLQLRQRRANTALSDASLHDPLTGLENRRSLDSALEAIATASAAGEDVAVALFDIDHFKDYNDTLGHLEGDNCLKRVAVLLQQELRGGTDRAFRFGGEEFLVLLRRTDLTAALGIAERLRRRIEISALPHRTQPTGVVTVSAGVAAMRLGGAISVHELLAAADTALYAAKRGGRNQVWPPFLAARTEQVIRMRRRDVS